MVVNVNEERIDELREIFYSYLREYSDDPNKSKDTEPFIFWMVNKFHLMLEHEEITHEEFGLLVDFVICW